MLDSANKRRSVFGLDGPGFGLGPVPDGVLSTLADIRHLAGHYRFADTLALPMTHNKRRSVFGLDGPFFVLGPVPDGSLASALDRRHLAGHYRLIVGLASAWTLQDSQPAWDLQPRNVAWTLQD